jgi:hypothetical protein
VVFERGVFLARKKGMAVAVIALAVFVLGGIFTFSGLGLLAFMGGRDLFGLGDGRSIGVFLVCVGLISSILGVFLMRLYRNRV